MTKELIILGMGPSARECPFDAEVWSVNNGYKQIAMMSGHVNKIFLAHKQVKSPQGNPYFDWDNYNGLSKLGCEVYNTHRVKGLKSKLYPKKRIAGKLGSDYFSDTICYMLAYAIDKATVRKNGHCTLKYPLKIRLYGVDMRETGEYALEKGGIEYWIGFARGLGIEVEQTEFSTICKTVTYAPYGDKDFNHKEFVDGSRIIIGWDGKIYARETWNKGRSDSLPEQQESEVELLP